MKRRLIFCLGLILLVGGDFQAETQPDGKPAHEKPATVIGISKEALQERLGKLNQGRDNALATLQAYDGAIQECQHWIDYLEKQKKEAQEAEKESKKPQKETGKDTSKEQKK